MAFPTPNDDPLPAQWAAVMLDQLALTTRFDRALHDASIRNPTSWRRMSANIADKELKRLAGVLAPLKVANMPLAVPPPLDSRFGSPLNLSKVHRVCPELVVEVTYLTWTEDSLLRQVSYQGQREDKPARQVVRPVPNPR
jgi:ATP-dependent DNA ligase